MCADHGIPLFGDKGACVHVQELVRAFADLGHQVQVLAARLGDAQGDAALPASARKIRVTASAAVESDEELETARRRHKECRYLDIAAAAEQCLVELHASWPFDLVYERYSLWSAAGVRAARRLGIPCIVEVNAPLLLEQQRFRRLVLAEQAATIECEVLGSASAVVCVSEQVARYARTHGASAANVMDRQTKAITIKTVIRKDCRNIDWCSGGFGISSSAARLILLESTTRCCRSSPLASNGIH